MQRILLALPLLLLAAAPIRAQVDPRRSPSSAWRRRTLPAAFKRWKWTS